MEGSEKGCQKQPAGEVGRGSSQLCVLANPPGIPVSRAQSVKRGSSQSLFQTQFCSARSQHATRCDNLTGKCNGCTRRAFACRSNPASGETSRRNRRGFIHGSVGAVGAGSGRGLEGGCFSRPEHAQVALLPRYFQSAFSLQLGGLIKFTAP